MKRAGTAFTRIGPGLREIANGACLYCGRVVAQHAGAQIDHFIPCSSHHDDAIENLVYAHGRCNNDKRACLAADPHVERWIRRLREPATGTALAELAALKQWEMAADKTAAIARSTYLSLFAGYKLWQTGKQFTAADPDRLRAAWSSVRSAAPFAGCSRVRGACPPGGEWKHRKSRSAPV